MAYTQIFFVYYLKITKTIKISNKIAKNFNMRIKKFTCLLKKV